MENLIPCAMWTNDSGGKQDYDGEMISISTRYWPGTKPSAMANIMLRLGPLQYEGGGESFTWREKHFEANTETQVKFAVEEWCAEQIRDVVALLGGISAFRKNT